jgi:hypothetical protein
MIQQNIQPRAQQGENFHLVGQNLSFNPMPSPPPQQTTKNIVNIDIDEPKHSGANRGAKKGQERTLNFSFIPFSVLNASLWLSLV